MLILRQFSERCQPPPPAVACSASVGGYVVGNGLNPTVADLTEAAAVATDASGAVPGSDGEARTRLGDYFAEVLLLDQGTTAAKARAALGWDPSHPGLADEFRHGSYAGVATHS